MIEKKKLDLAATFNALDIGDRNYYNSLSDEDKKLYAPIVLMRFMSSLSDQSSQKEYAVIAVNELVNINFWSLSKFPDLQHLLLCLTGTGKRKQYRPWIPKKGSKSSFEEIDNFLLELHPEMNKDELSILKSQFDSQSFKQLLLDSGISDSRVKTLNDEFKKYLKNESV
jgi:hypothetical protein